MLLRIQWEVLRRTLSVKPVLQSSLDAQLPTRPQPYTAVRVLIIYLEQDDFWPVSTGKNPRSLKGSCKGPWDIWLVSTTSSNASRTQKVSTAPDREDSRKIGLGSCRSVFEVPGTERRFLSVVDRAPEEN